MVYAAACYVPTSKDGKVGFAGLGLASLVRLRLDGADLQRLFVEDKYAHPAFQYGPVSYDQSGSLPRLALMYFMRVPELGRHHSLLPEEKDLSRDWDTLGSTRAWVTCHFVDEHQVRPFPLESRALILPSAPQPGGHLASQAPPDLQGLRVRPRGFHAGGSHEARPGARRPHHDGTRRVHRGSRAPGGADRAGRRDYPLHYGRAVEEPVMPKCQTLFPHHGQ